MGKDIVSETIFSRTPTFSRDAADIIDYCLSGAEIVPGDPHKITLVNMPSEADRGRLTARHHELMKALRDHDSKQIAVIISRMLGSYDVARPLVEKQRTEKEKRETIAKYVQELKGVPTWAVYTACERIRLGSAPDISHVYPPTTIQLRVLAVSIAQPWKDQARSIGNILTAEKYVAPVSEEERKRVGVLITELATSMKLRQEQSRNDSVARDRARAEAVSTLFIEREYKARGEEPSTSAGIVLSRALVESVKAGSAARDALGSTIDE